jgi:hypothetical protein
MSPGQPGVIDSHGRRARRGGGRGMMPVLVDGDPGNWPLVLLRGRLVLLRRCRRRKGGPAGLSP